MFFHRLAQDAPSLSAICSETRSQRRSPSPMVALKCATSCRSFSSSDRVHRGAALPFFLLCELLFCSFFFSEIGGEADADDEADDEVYAAAASLLLKVIMRGNLRVV